MIAVFEFLALATGVGFLWYTITRQPKADFSGLNTRFEELHTRLRAIESIFVRLESLDRSLAALPPAIEGVRLEIKTMFERFEEQTLPSEAKAIGAAALSRVERARQAMERASEDSLRAFNTAVDQKSRRADEPIVIRGAL